MIEFHPTIVDCLTTRAESEPERSAFWFLRESREQEPECLTYGALHLRAAVLAREIADRVAPFERVAILQPQSVDLLVSFVGCLYARVIPILLYPPHAQRRDDRLLAILSNAAVSLLLASPRARGQIVANPHYTALPPVLTVETSEDSGRTAIVTDLPRGHPQPEDVAFLQYTSGSTQRPRGVAVSHGNLVANMSMILGSMGWDRTTVMASWLPMFHDMGLIGDTLTPIYAGFPCAKLAPVQFLRNPSVWLDAVTRFRATTIGAPNFAYDHCVERIPEESLCGMDLSTLEVAYCGAEPVRDNTLRKFSSRFEPCGFRSRVWVPCYGLAEATLIVSGSQLNAFPRTAAVPTTQDRSDGDGEKRLPDRASVSCGRPCDGQTLRIVDPESKTSLSERQVGEIWIAGPHVAAQFWNSPAATSETLGQRTSEGTSGFLRTGDLGFLDGGELFICGRIKDIIIIHGNKYHPEDIEETVRGCRSDLRLAKCAAFPVLTEGTEKTVVLVESPGRELPPMAEEWTKAIGRAVYVHHGVPLLDCRIVPRGTIPTTTSGKIQRQACKGLYATLIECSETVNLAQRS